MLFCDLDEKQVDALREVGNVGAGHAATALSQLVGRQVTLAVPKVEAVPFPRVSAILGGPESEVACLYMKVFGDTRGNILIVFPPKDLAALVALMLNKPSARCTRSRPWSAQPFWRWETSSPPAT